MKLAAAVIFSGVLLLAGDKNLSPGRTGNDNVGVEAKVFLTKEEVKSAVGSELDEGFIVVQITLTPRNGETVKINRDDFLLLSGRDGQKSQPYAPSQIAGAGALVVASRAGQGGGMMGQQRTVPWGGIGGRPMGMPSPGGSIGSTTANPTEASATTTDGDNKKPNPLLDTLKEKILPEKEITEPVSGQLYFLLEGKHKLKDLELFYKGPGGKLSLKFVR